MQQNNHSKQEERKNEKEYTSFYNQTHPILTSNSNSNANSISRK